MVAYHRLPHPGIQTLAPYIPGKSAETVAKEQGLGEVIKLASNENPLGTSPSVLTALAKLTPHEIATYQITSLQPLREHLANVLGVEREMILLSNGSDTIFYYILLSFALHSGKRMVTHEKAFIQYEIQAKTLGIPVHQTALNADLSVDVDALIQAATPDTAAIFLANPNNPTGLLIEPSEVIRLLSAIPSEIIVVLDEAYFEYLPTSKRSDIVKLLQHYPNLIVTRTFSKIYGLAALRLGYAIANSSLISILYRVQLPFIVNLAALTAAEAALQDHSFIEHTQRNNTQGMAQLKKGLHALGVQPLPSFANFLTFDTGFSARQVDLALQKQGVITRPLEPYGMTQYLRVTIGTPAQNHQFLSALSQALQELDNDTLSEKM